MPTDHPLTLLAKIATRVRGRHPERRGREPFADCTARIARRPSFRRWVALRREGRAGRCATSS